jgi:hypothetical protein
LAPFELRDDRHDLRLELAASASLEGRVLGIPPGRERAVRVVVLGGAATTRSVAVTVDGDFRFAALDPGDYVLCAFLGEDPRALEDRVLRLLEAPDRGWSHRLTLAAGESQVRQVQLELPPTGSVRGTLTINGSPPSGCRIELQPGDGSRRLSAVPDARGVFVLDEVLAQDYTVRVTVAADGRQEIHREDLRVTANATSQVDRDLRCGGLRGQVVASDGTPPELLEGRVYLLPGVDQAPVDLGAYARDHRVHELRVRGGGFGAEVLTAGAALVLVQIRGRAPLQRTIEISAGAVREAVWPAGDRR